MKFSCQSKQSRNLSLFMNRLCSMLLLSGFQASSSAACFERGGIGVEYKYWKAPSRRLTFPSSKADAFK